MGYKIMEIRKKKNMTQLELSQKSGVSRVVINGLESGRIDNTTTNTLIAIANALGVTLDELIFFDETV